MKSVVLHRGTYMFSLVNYRPSPRYFGWHVVRLSETTNLAEAEANLLSTGNDNWEVWSLTDELHLPPAFEITNFRS